MTKKVEETSKAPIVKRDSKGRFLSGFANANPTGSPKRGQSWGEIVKDITDKTAEELIEFVGGEDTQLGRLLSTLPRGVALKHLIATRAAIELMINPQANLFTAIVDRQDGKATTPIEAKGDLSINVTFDRFIGKDVSTEEE